MNSVAPPCRAAPRSAAASPGGASAATRAPRKLCTGGRGPAAGGAEGGGAPPHPPAPRGGGGRPADQRAALPAGEVGVLQGQLGERRRPTGREDCIEGSELAGQQAER